MRMLKSRLPLISILIVCIAIFCFLALVIGSPKISPVKAFTLLFMPDGSPVSILLWLSRMPRLILGIFAGSMLVIAGALCEGMVGPRRYGSLYILGGSLLAALFISGASLIYNTAYFGRQVDPYLWLMGSLASAGWNKVLLVLPFVIIAVLLSIFYYKDLNAMLLGEDLAHSLGIDVRFIRIFLCFMALVLICAAIYAAGTISVILLLTPHFAKKAAGANYKYLIPISVLTGSLIMVFADIVSRIVLTSEIAIGIVFIVIAAPFAVNLVLSRR